jgi:hypothetical protein
MRFAQKIILGFLMVFTLGCTHNKKPKLVKSTPKPLVWHIAGLPNWFYLSNSKIIYKRWGINIFLEGCSGSIVGVKNNKKVAKILEKRHGKYWQQVFEMSVDEEIVNRYSVIDLVFKSKEAVKIQKKFNVSKNNSNTRVIYIRKNQYAVLVTWYDPSDENKQIPGQQLIVNLATKAVVKSNENFDWRRVY